MPNKNILLLIEDNPLLTGMYKAAFEKKGVSVVFAHDGKTGLDRAKKEKPDVILLDVFMPGMDGFEVLRDLRSNSETKDIKVIILTISNKKEHQDKAKEFGVIDYLIKSELKLHEIVERVLKYFS